jgi:hypothetical protein
VTALAFWPVDAGGLNSRTSYPRLFLGSSADTNVICSLDACAKRDLLRATCVSSNQTRVLLVSLELAVVEKGVKSNVTVEMMSPRLRATYNASRGF